MSQNNNSMSPEMVMGIMVVAAIGAVMLLMAAAFAFVALALSAVAIFALEKPITFMGETVNPDGARAYLLRGVAGAILAPIFVAFCGGMFQYDLGEISKHAWQLIMLTGYCIGSLGIEIAIYEEQQKAIAVAANAQEILPPLPPQPKAQEPHYTAKEGNFAFAEWLD